MKAKRRLLALFFSVLMIWQGFFFAKAEGEGPTVSVSTGMPSSNGEERERQEQESPIKGEMQSVEAVDPGAGEGMKSSEINMEEGNPLLLKESESQVVSEIHAVLNEEPAFFSKELVNGQIQKVKDEGGMDHYLLEYVIRFNAKKYEGVWSGNESFEIVDTLNPEKKINEENPNKNLKLKYFDPANYNSEISIDKKYSPSIRSGEWKKGKYKEENGNKVFHPEAGDSDEGDFVYALVEDPNRNRDVRLYYPWDSSPARSFSYSFDSISPTEGFELRYFVEIDELPVQGGKVENEAKLFEEPKTWGDPRTELGTETVNYIVGEDGNSFKDDGVSIIIEKKDDEGNLLKGAEFLITRENSTYSRVETTDGNGRIVLSQLLPRDYIVREITPPKGYEKDRKDYKIKKEDFANNQKFVLSLVNKRIDPEFRDIIVEKRWLVPPPPKSFPNSNNVPPNSDYEEIDLEELEGMDSEAFAPLALDASENRDLSAYNLPEEGTKEESGSTMAKPKDVVVIDADDTMPDDNIDRILAGPSWDRGEVTILLYANNEKVDSAKLSYNENPAQSYRHVFKNKPRKDKDGNEIIYTVKEEKIDGYETVISGSADTIFTVVNFSGDFLIPVTKIWKGKAPHPKELKVYLYANGKQIRKATLSARNDWQHIFLSLPKPDMQGKIDYEVREEQLEGYNSERKDFGNGYNNVFINTKNNPPDDPHNPPDDPHNPPDNPGGGGGTPPHNPGGGRPPRVIENPPGNGTTPPPTTPESPGEVLGTDRSTPDSKKETKQILGADREPEVLGTGRGWTKTFDSGMIQLYFALCLVSAAGFALSLLYKKKSMIRRK